MDIRGDVCRIESSIFSASAGGWMEANTFLIEKPLARDPRGVLLATADGGGFTAYAPAIECTGSYSLTLSGATGESGWNVRCHASDDPWPVYQSGDASSATSAKGFLQSGARLLYRRGHAEHRCRSAGVLYGGNDSAGCGRGCIVVAGVDGKVQMVENGALKAVPERATGAAILRDSLGVRSGTQVIASGSGEAVNDSLRAFEIPALEAVPASAPLAMDGTVTALWTAPDGKSVFAVVRSAAGEYEVDRVTALCN